ncbi:anthranilate synthase component I [Paenibacillus yanchengensis]|uniref:Anthranilate synthase n=1 Tax=Paenibacillus yanchengensis TaxID=2035833 RepID=A0ABW4YLM8_9BACL
MSILSHLQLTPEEKKYKIQENVFIYRNLEPLKIENATNSILNEINNNRGALFTSGYEYPGRYSRWDIGFVNPPIEMRSSGKNFTIKSLNNRGEILLSFIYNYLIDFSEVTVHTTNKIISGTIHSENNIFSEDERTLQPSIFTVIRLIKNLFASSEDSYLGLYGAFGYDLVFQFESMELKHSRNSDQADLVLYLPDELVIVDHQLACAYQLSYDFDVNGNSTKGLERTNPTLMKQKENSFSSEAYQLGKYANLVEEAIKSFQKGDLFEVVPSHTIYEKCIDSPSNIFSRLKAINPSPYGFIINLGDEYLVGSSPEMYVRVEGNRVETCPISGTVKRGASAIEDAEQIKSLLNSSKDEAELTMCTDVDRNDKSRVCIPGSVEVIGRRQLEMYSHLIHTVDHVEGRLSPQFDSLDAFMTHMWAVTITGAPKRAAIRWIEEHESSPRGWYGGAVGYYAFNGDLNTGLTLRTIRIKNDIAEVRVGATLLIDSIPEDEEAETLTKAAALVEAIRGNSKPPKIENKEILLKGKGKKILIIDHEDSFVLTLSSYFKQTGADVLTLRASLAQNLLKTHENFDLVVLSPGPGRPEEFNLKKTIDLCLLRNIPIFGVCLGMQGIVEYFGGKLNILNYPQHGKSSSVNILRQSALWNDISENFTVGRYHSLYAEIIPDCLDTTAVSDDGIVMAIEHKALPISAVQFHPESILSLRNSIGLKIIQNIISQV